MLVSGDANNLGVNLGEARGDLGGELDERFSYAWIRVWSTDMGGRPSLIRDCRVSETRSSSIARSTTSILARRSWFALLARSRRAEYEDAFSFASSVAPFLTSKCSAVTEYEEAWFWPPCSEPSTACSPCSA